MRILTFVILALIISVDVLSQDLIVTNDNDSLNCKITKIKSDFIHFTFMYNDEVRNTLLSVSSIKRYQKIFI